MFITWQNSGDTADFILLLILSIMCLIRYRFKSKLISRTIFIDLLAVLLFFFLDGDVVVETTIIFVLFQAMYLGFYPVVLLIGYLAYATNFSYLILAISISLVGLVLNFWQKEREARFTQRDYYSEKNFELEILQSDLTIALAQVEQMSIVTERSRISRDIHDNAGHEIVAAFISLQTVGKIMKNNPEKATELFDKSMERLDAGVKKMRDAVHNVSAVTFMGADKMQELCERFEQIPVKFKATGDMTCVTSNMWYVLEAVLNESLTNAMKHSRASNVCVELDVTKYLVRLMIENDGVTGEAKPAGSGVRNLKHRVNTVGGNLTVDASATFKVVCVIPIN